MKSNSMRNLTNEETHSALQSASVAEPLEGRFTRPGTVNRPIALIQVPNQRLFGPKAAAKYLGICEDTLKKITDLEQLRAFNLNGRRAYRLEDLEQFIESLPGWYDALGEKSAEVVVKGKP
jgi:hypothetical protein